MIVRSQRQLALTRVAAIGSVVALLLAGALWWVVREPWGSRVTAYFDKAVGVYVGSSVRVLGIPVGEITDVRPEGAVVRVEMVVDDGVRVPADAHAVVVAPSLVSDRYVQLTPAYSGGAELGSNAVIPRERTATPIELDELYASVDKLAGQLGPNGANANGALSDLLDTAAANLVGNGQNLNDTLSRLADAASTLDASKADLFGTIDGLQRFTTALADSDGQIHEFYQRLAEVTTFLADDRDDIGLALSSLAAALLDVQAFVDDNKDLLASNVDNLTGVTKALVDQRAAIAEILDVAPLGVGNLVNSYDAASGTIGVRANLNELTNPPILMVCQLVRQGTARQIPATLADICGRLAPVLDGTLRLPSVAESLPALQQGKLPPLPLPLADVLIPVDSGARGGGRR